MQISVEIAQIVILIISVIIHEVAHGYAANALGDPTAKLAGRLTLNPLPHIDLFGSILIPFLLIYSHAGILFGYAKPVPYNPYNLKNKRWGEAIVAGAGSATNIILAILFALVLRFAPLTSNMASFAATIVLVNLFLGIFNLIPFPPLDGFTFIRGLLPFRFAYPLHQFENSIRAYGVMAIVLFLLVFSYVLAGPFYALVLTIFHLLVG